MVSNADEDSLDACEAEALVLEIAALLVDFAGECLGVDACHLG